MYDLFSKNAKRDLFAKFYFSFLVVRKTPVKINSMSKILIPVMVLV
jgi:hypothetical protein